MAHPNQAMQEPIGDVPDRPAPSGDAACEVIVTAADPDWLADFTRLLIDERLAACGHLGAPIRSIYRWDGAIQDEPEARVALHTRMSLVPRIVEEAARRHPYEVPCVIALPIAGGNHDYLRWILDETLEPPTSG